MHTNLSENTVLSSYNTIFNYLKNNGFHVIPRQKNEKGFELLVALEYKPVLLIEHKTETKQFHRTIKCKRYTIWLFDGENKGKGIGFLNLNEFLICLTGVVLILTQNYNDETLKGAL